LFSRLSAKPEPYFATRALFRVLLACALCPLADAQSPQEYVLRVNGSPLVIARPATRVAGEWFVPLAAVAKALAADISIDPKSQSIRVLRSDGVAATYDGATGRILQGLVVAGDVKNFHQIQLNTGLENLMFPVSGVVPLLSVTVREDPDRDVLEIDALPPAEAGAVGSTFHPLCSTIDTGSPPMVTFGSSCSI
jgi:hypothetical protein